MDVEAEGEELGSVDGLDADEREDWLDVDVERLLFDEVDVWRGDVDDSVVYVNI